MKLRLALLLGLILSLVLFVLYLGNWIGPLASSIRTVKQVDYAWFAPSGQMTPTTTVGLPHSWRQSDVLPGGLGIYRFTLPAYDEQEQEQEPWAVSVFNYMPATELLLAGKTLPWTRLTGHIGQAAFASLGTIAPGQTIEFKVPQHFGIQGGLGAIHIGPSRALKQRAWVISVLRNIGHIWTMGMALAVSFASLVAFWFRRVPYLLVITYSALAISIRFALPYIFGYWSDDNIQLSLFMFSGVSMVAGIAFLILQSTKYKIGRFTLTVTIGMGLLAALLFTQTGSFELRRFATIGTSLLVIGFALFHSWNSLLLKKYSILLAIIVLVFARWVITFISASTNQGLFGYADINTQTAFTPLLILIGTLIAARYFTEAFRTYELTNGRLHQEVNAYKAKLAVISEREKERAVEQAAENERLHWMQEIHDGLGSHLIAARFIAEKATSIDELHDVKNSIDDGIEELRELVDSLSPGQSTVPSILGAMRYRMNARFESAGMHMRWDVDPMIEAKEIGPKDALNVQRITQEALTNVLKHSQAQMVCIHIFTRNGFIIVHIDDDGKGFMPDETNSGRGISNMRGRAQACNGKISWIAMTPGTRVELSLPNS